MSGFLEGLGPSKEVVNPEDYIEDKPKITPFQFIDDITTTKKNLIVDEWSKKQYNPYIINKGLSFGRDTVILANEMNSRFHLDNDLQNQFLINTIRPSKRYNKWYKHEKSEEIELIKEYYGYSNEKAYAALNILSKENLDYIRQKLRKGGI